MKRLLYFSVICIGIWVGLGLWSAHAGLKSAKRQLDTPTATDMACMADCAEAGYSWAYCNSICSY